MIGRAGARRLIAVLVIGNAMLAGALAAYLSRPADDAPSPAAVIVTTPVTSPAPVQLGDDVGPPSTDVPLTPSSSVPAAPTAAPVPAPTAPATTRAVAPTTRPPVPTSETAPPTSSTVVATTVPPTTTVAGATPGA